MTNPFEQYATPQQQNPFARYTQRPEERSNALAAALSGAADTFSFGYGDELQGLLFGEEAMQAARQRQENFRANNPLAFGGGQIAGGLVGGGVLGAAGRAALGGARALRNVNWAGRAGLAALSGGAGLSAYSAGSAPDGERLQAAAENFLPGAALGGGFSVLGSAIGPTLQRAWRGANPENAATDLLARGIQREGGSASVLGALDEHASMARGGTLLDAMGESGEHLAGGAAIRPSAGRTAMRDMLEARNTEMGPRAQREIGQAFTGGDNAGQMIQRFRQVQREQAAPLYAQAWQEVGRVNPQQMRATLGETMRRHPDIFEPAQMYARRLSLAETGQEIADEADPRYWHYMLQGAELELGKRMRAGYMGDLRGYQGAEIATYTRAVRQFNNQVRRALGPTFRRAQDTYSGAASAAEAVESGYDAFRPNLNSIQLEGIMQRFARMRPGDQQNFRAAFASRLQDAISSADTTQGRVDALRSIMGTEARQRLIRRVLGEEAVGNLLRRFDYDRTLFQTGYNTGIRTNSHTAPLLSAEQSVRESSLTPATMQGSWLERIFGPELRRAADVRNEEVSTRLLDMLSTPAADAATALRSGGQLGTSGGLLSAAVRRARELENFRRDRALANLFGGAYAGVGGDTLVNVGTGQTSGGF